MKKNKLPNTDSVQKLADFWDAHDVTDFEGELEEVVEPVFLRTKNGRAAINVPLKVCEARAVERMAHAKGISPQELVGAWVRQKIARRPTPIGRPARRVR